MKLLTSYLKIAKTMDNKNERIELLPCPFCGEMPVMRAYKSDKDARSLHCIAAECPINPQTRMAINMGSALADWNTRAAMKPATAAILIRNNK